MAAVPNIEPSTIPRIVVVGNPDLVEAATAAAVGVPVWSAVLTVVALVVLLVGEGADVEVEIDDGVDWIENSVPNNVVAFIQLFAFALNIHNTSSSFPPDITTKPLESVAIEYSVLVLLGASVEL
jgi:hypothetical protein